MRQKGDREKSIQKRYQKERDKNDNEDSGTFTENGQRQVVEKGCCEFFRLRKTQI